MTPERKCPRREEPSCNAPRAESKSTDRTRQQDPTSRKSSIRQPYFESPKRRGSKAEIKTTKKLPAHQAEVALARNSKHYSLEQTKETQAVMKAGPLFPQLASLVAVTKKGSCYHHWDCRTLFWNSATSPASGQVYSASVRVVTFEVADEYGYQRCRACIDALRGKMTITPKRVQRPKPPQQAPAEQPAPVPTKPRLHPMVRAAERQARVSPLASQASHQPQEVEWRDGEELEEGETSPPEYDSTGDEMEHSASPLDRVHHLQCKYQ